MEKELGFKDKKDIEAYGMDNFTNKCIQRIQRFSEVITGQSKRLGQWMDWDNSYYTHSDENISAIWHFLKLCHEKDMIAQSYRPMPWCPRCGTSLSEHEMSGSHKEITHTAVFAVAKIKSADYDALVWTTTPWTLAANVALAVNPKLDYAIVKCEGYEKPLALAKNAIKHIEGSKEVIRLIKGEEIIGHKYETFFPDLPIQKEINHIIIPWDDVGADEGSGIVHIAPGCGAEDYDLGKKFSLAEICPVDESGVFLPGYDFLTGYTAAEAAVLVFDKLGQQGKLYKTHEYTHSYPVCWRCKTEVLFRLVREWYIKTDAIRPQLIQAANTVKWEPAFIGKRMHDWLNNMGDWNISRKRFYGLPLPFYPCEACGFLAVIGSKEELLNHNKNADLPHLHRPWIDAITINCPGCGGIISRIPEVGDVWLDAGIVPFSTLGYFTDKNEWQQNFPAQWVVEMQEQVRLWFYSQLFMSVVITGKAPYERVQTNNWVLAEDGTRFSKTGHMIPFDEAASRVGADTIRYLFAGASMASDVRFGYSLGEVVRRKLLGFWNIYTFFMTYAVVDKPVISRENSHPSNIMDRWLYNRVAAFVRGSTASYESYNLVELMREFERLVDDISNWYIRANRRRFWKEGTGADKQEAYSALFYAIKSTAQVMAPVIPFVTEYIWQNMILVHGHGEESVHLSDFPTTRDFDTQVLGEVDAARKVIAQGLKLRNEHNLKIKQPLSTMYLHSSSKEIEDYTAIVGEELNVKEIVFLDNFDALSSEWVALNYQTAGRQLKGDLNRVKGILESLPPLEHEKLVSLIKEGTPIKIPGYEGDIPVDCFSVYKKDNENIAKSDTVPEVAISIEMTLALKKEGMYRELLRHCQLLRKEAGYSITDRVVLCLCTESEVVQAVIDVYADDIGREALALVGDVLTPVMCKDVVLEEGVVVVSIGDGY
ncbi:MAG: class I tRNA ligase family protein [Defluviitaleaceae bacterium]|nr:class I tRNA ligase family protein [Defluviitaleaceae bacterium]